MMSQDFFVAGSMTVFVAQASRLQVVQASSPASAMSKMVCISSKPEVSATSGSHKPSCAHALLFDKIFIAKSAQNVYCSLRKVNDLRDLVLGVFWRCFKRNERKGNDMEDKIGMDAGKIWEKLSTSGPLTQTDLSKKMNLSAPELQRAIGWLAREGKISEIRDAKGNVKIGLKQ
jgi:hypothetical protein